MDEERHYCEGVGQLTDEEDALCAALGIDPAEVNGVRIVVEPGKGAYAVWTSRRRVDLGRVAIAIEPPAPIADPWDGVEACGISTAGMPPIMCARKRGHEHPHRAADGTEF